MPSSENVLTLQCRAHCYLAIFNCYESAIKPLLKNQLIVEVAP